MLVLDLVVGIKDMVPSNLLAPLEQMVEKKLVA